MTRGKVDLTIDDVIATLRNSNVPNVVVEGRDDIVVFRRLEEILSDHYVSVLSVGGQNKVLQVFDRKGELPDRLCVSFITDRDRWAYGDVPDLYSDPTLVITDGYSLENDAIRDGDFCSLMSPAERASFFRELDIVLKWYAIAITRFLSGQASPLKTHPDQLFDNQNLEAESDAELERNEDARAMLEKLRANPFKLLRGKTLFALMMRQLSYRGRAAHHSHLALLDTVGANPGELIQNLFLETAAALGVEAGS